MTLGQTGSNSAVYVLERIGGADIANLERASVPKRTVFRRLNASVRRS
jgi:hypothetical protein